MPGDAPLLERLAQMPAVPAAEATDLLERLDDVAKDPLLGPLFGVDEEGDAVVNPLVPSVLQQFQEKGGLTRYAALPAGLAGVAVGGLAARGGGAPREGSRGRSGAPPRGGGGGSRRPSGRDPSP